MVRSIGRQASVLYSLAFTLAGDVGFGVGFLGALLLVLVAVAMFFLAWAIYTTRHPRNPEKAPGWYYRKGVYVMAIAAVFLALSAFTYPFIPVVSFSKLQPTQFVSVQAQQFSWTFNTTKIIAGQPVEFIVTSKDVTHGFGVYDSNGTLLLQEQVMPGFDNDFVYTFTTPGVYTVRCLEYCGFGHPYMVTSFAVVTG
jgi:cytochrome c oxidase subunit 2